MHAYAYIALIEREKERTKEIKEKRDCTMPDGICRVSYVAGAFLHFTPSCRCCSVVASPDTSALNTDTDTNKTSPPAKQKKEMTKRANTQIDPDRTQKREARNDDRSRACVML